MRETYAKYTPIAFFLGAIWLRLWNLGYSDFQGDEIKALFLPLKGQSLTDFLLEQRKGPIQFLITYLLKFFDQAYQNEFFIRLPFAIAGILAVYIFYKVVREHFGPRIALYAAGFMAFNGLFVALSRIVQYQAFVFLFSALVLYFFTLASKQVKWRIAGIYLGGISWALAILSHYDGVFIFPFALFILWDWFTQDNATDKKARFLHLAAAGLISLGVVAVFYAPYVFYISEATKEYWLGRIGGTGGKVSSSVLTHKVYNPIYVTDIYLALAVVGLLRLRKNWKILVWLIVPLAFMEGFVDVPGTHIYTYLLPLFIVMAYGIDVIETVMRKIIPRKYALHLTAVGLGVFFSFTFLQSNAIFVNHNLEYPWEPEKFLFWEFHQPSPAYHLSLFGFPYYRNWEGIGEYLKNTETNGWYSTNERKSIARYHIDLQKDTNNAGHFVYIHRPQSFTKYIVEEKAQYWADNYEPVKIFKNKNGRILAEIFYMPEGDLKTINNLGY